MVDTCYPIFCRSLWMNLSIVYICTILIVLTHTHGYRWFSSPSVLILCRSTTYCTKFLAAMMLGDTSSFIDALRARIHGNQYKHANFTQIGNCMPSYSKYYLCSIFHHCLVVSFLLMSKRLVSKVDIWIIW